MNHKIGTDKDKPYAQSYQLFLPWTKHHMVSSHVQV